MDGQTKVVNRSLGNLLRCLTKKYAQSWNLLLPQDEFSFNDVFNRSKRKKPFEIVYCYHPKGPLELRELPHDIKVSAQGEELADLIK